MPAIGSQTGKSAAAEKKIKAAAKKRVIKPATPKQQVQQSRAQARTYGSQAAQLKTQAKRQRKQAKKKQAAARRKLVPKNSLKATQRSQARAIRALSELHASDPKYQRELHAQATGKTSKFGQRSPGSSPGTTIGDVAKRELEGRGLLAKGLRTLAEKRADEQAKLVPGTKGSPKMRSAMPGSVKIASNTAKDALTFPSQAIPSVYVPVAAAVEAARGDTSRAKKLIEDVKQTDPVYNTVAAGVEKLKGNEKAAKSHIEKAKKAATEHPGLTALEVAGVKGGVGRVTSRTLRGGGRTVRRVGRVTRVKPVERAGEKIRKAGSTERASRQVPGTNIVERRDYSRDSFTKARQIAQEKAARKRAARKREQAVRARAKGHEKDARKLEKEAEHGTHVAGVRVLRGNPERVPDRELRRQVDEDVQVNTDIQQVHRGRTIKGTKKIIKRAGRGKEALSVIAQRIARSDKADLKALVKEWEAQAPHLSHSKLVANQEARALIQKVIDDPKVNMANVEAAAKAFYDLTAPAQKRLGELEVIAPKQIQKATVIPYAVRRMGGRSERTPRLSPTGVQKFVTKEERKAADKRTKKAQKRLVKARKELAEATASARVSVASRKSSPTMKAAEREVRAAQAELGRTRRREHAQARVVAVRKSKAERRRAQTERSFLRSNKEYATIERELAQANAVKRLLRREQQIRARFPNKSREAIFAEMRIPESVREQMDFSKLPTWAEASARSRELAAQLEATATAIRSKPLIRTIKSGSGKGKGAIKSEEEFHEIQREIGNALDSLDPVLANDLKHWSAGVVGGSANKLRDVEGIARSFEPVREFLRQRYGSTIRLMRGVRPHGKDDQRLLTSWTLNRRLAEEHAGEDGKVLVRDVPIDDIVAAIADSRHIGADAYFNEILVRRPKSRRVITGRARVKRAERREIAPEATTTKPAEAVVRAKERVAQAERAVATERRRIKGVDPKRHDRLLRAIEARDKADAALTDARVAAFEARAAHIKAKKAGVGKKDKIIPGLVDEHGRPLTLDLIQREMEAAGESPAAFVTQAPSRAVEPNVRAERAPGVKNKVRTGAGVAQGTIDVSSKRMVESALRTQQLVDATEGFRKIMHGYLLRDGTGEVLRFKNADLADQAAADYLWHADGSPNPGAPPMRKVGLVPIGGKKATLENLIEDVNKLTEDQASNLLESLKNAVSEQPTGNGPWGLMPEVAAQRIHDHLSALSGSGGLKALAVLQSQARKAVLATSASWLAGNVGEAAFRSAIMRAGPRSLLQGALARKDVKALGGQAALDELMSRVLGGGQMAQANRAGLRGKGDQFKNTGMEGVANALTNFFELPGPKQGAWLWNAYTDIVMKQLSGRIESTFQTAMLGKALRDSPLLDQQMLKLSKKARLEAAQGLVDTPTMRQFGRKVDDAYGRYSKHPPWEKKAISYYTPFISWWLNSVNFVYRVLPRDHPIVTGLIASAEMATEEWRKDNHLDKWIDDAVPGWLQGSIPLSGGRHQRAPFRYTPFAAFGDPGGVAAGQVNPLVSGILAALQGRDWTGRELRVTDENGKSRPANDLERARFGAEAFLDVTIPFLSVGKRIAKKGVVKAINPVEPVSPPKPKSSSRKLKRGSSGGGGGGTIYDSGGSSGSGGGGTIYD